MATSEQVTGKVDWIKVRFKKSNPEQVFENLLKIDLNKTTLSNGKLAYYNYNCYFSYGAIHVYSYKEALFLNDCMLQLSGEACTQLKIILDRKGSSWSDFFKSLFNYTHIEILRLDVALDDRNKIPYFKISQLISKAKKALYWSNNREYLVHESKYKLTTGKTLNFGARTSNLMIRIYDKAIEQAKMKGVDITEYGSWNRVEIELKKELADDMARRIAYDDETLENQIRGVLREELRFYTDETKQKVPRFWDRFLLKALPIKLDRKYDSTTMESTINWLDTKGALAAYQAIVFLKKNNALGSLNDITDEYKEFSRGLAERLTAHLVSIEREDLIVDVQERTKNEKREGE